MKTMTSRKLNCCSLLTMAIILVLTKRSEAHSEVPVSPYCKTCTIPNLCNRVVNGAANWNEAMVKSINACTQISYRIQNVTTNILPQITGIEPQSKISIQNTCKEAMDSAVSDLKEAMKALTKNDPGTMLTNLASLHTDCADALEQFGIKFSPLNKVVGRYLKFMSVALSVAQCPQ
ncbi:putative endoglucanase 25-like [Capsicum annuum]|uniref:Pectinesterase inhibitor domain-containing protein n=1 Tax=Capsicum annuum TaxID=4072 RepID=A0A1U8EHX6_CAPAN|nr:uncharacterized protein LOC107847094 [Capsicum annuum]KAF3653058.1 putative endoglucanase 25-like [Capsicum annuum]KAF3679427.1 putative endoglucanase 25-like [Capsicum annuum]PHT68299.1 hypothetical protein T459_27786 [Capsicum annuum]